MEIIKFKSTFITLLKPEQIPRSSINRLNAELNLLALLGAHHIFHVSGLRVNLCVNKPTNFSWLTT